MDTRKELKDKNDQPHKSSNDALKKYKSTINITDKCAMENKAPGKQALTRSKTMSSINTRGVKRPATSSTIHGDAKKPFVRPVAKVAAGSTRSGTLTNATAKSSQSAKVGKAQNSSAPVKPMKWDLKGRLAQASDELLTLRQQYKETASKCSQLEEELNTLKATESTYKEKAEKYETLNVQLDKDFKETQAKNESLSKQLQEAKETVEQVSSLLEEFKKKCHNQESKISKQEYMVKDLQSNLDNQMKVNEELEKLTNELQTLVHTMDKDRRVLHNAIQEMKGNIRVFCRVRPRTNEELGKPTCTMNFIDECTIEIGKFDSSGTASSSGKYRGSRQEFSFDKVFPPTAKQEHVFEELAMLVQSALEGYNVCVFAYGQTGSGKTYTMEGLPGIETEGMIPRTVRHIFQEMREFQLLGWEYRIEASFLEIYNEHIVDLLDCQAKQHEIRMADPKGHDLFVTNLRIQEIHNPEELHECLLIAQRNRAVAATQSNERSSRSHSVARIKLIGTHKTKEEVSIGNLNLVDLAGSERLKNEESVRIAETKNINKSLANLGNVILALLKKQEHIPYRNSKLTHLLMPSLGGNSKTLMLLNVSPLEECYNETLNSLRFASNVNSCKMGNAKRTRTVLQTST